MIAAAVGFLAFGGAVAVVLVARQRFRSRVTARVGVLFSNAVETVGDDQLNARWDTLPEPVRRYFRYAIPGQAVAIGTARLKQDGFMRMTPSSRWFRVDGEEYFTVARPGFVWNASLWPAPPVWIEARDSLLSNRGEMLIKVYSLFTIADARSAEIDQGARLRWLAECVWLPYGFIGSGIAWEPIDGRSARATLLGDGLPVSAVVEIDEEGKLTCIRGDRYRDLGGGR